MGLEIIETSEKSTLLINDFFKPSWVGRYHQINACVMHKTSVNYSKSSVFPKEPKLQETWEVGYIANVLWEKIDAVYGAERIKKTFDFGGPVLDKLHQTNKTAWYSDEPELFQENMQQNITVFTEFEYGGNLQKIDGTKIADLTFVDFPRRSYLNELNGYRGAPQLRLLNDEIMFGIWIAAKRKSDPVNQLNSYNILFAKAVLLPIQLEFIGGDFWPVTGRKEGKKQPTVKWVGKPKEKKRVTPFTAPHQRANISIKSVSPVVNGPSANMVLGHYLINSGICGTGR